MYLDTQQPHSNVTGANVDLTKHSYKRKSIKFGKEMQHKSSHLVKQGRVYPGIKFNVQILQTAAKSFAILESPPPKVHIFNVLKKLPRTLEFTKHRRLVHHHTNIGIHKFFFEVIKSNSSPTSLHVNNLNHILTKWSIATKALKCSFVMVQNNHSRHNKTISVDANKDSSILK